MVVQRLETVTSAYAIRIRAICGSWSPGTRTIVRPPDLNPPDDAEVGGYYTGDRGRLECPTDGQPAKGIRGRYGAYVDSVALVCGPVILASSGKSAAQLGGSTAPALPGAASAIIKFDEAPAGGSVITLSAARGGDIAIRASGGTAALSMTLSVTENMYRPFFTLVMPPAPATLTPAIASIARPPVNPPVSAPAAPQVASITRIVRLRPNAPLITGYATIVTIPVIVSVRNANGAVATRAFVVMLQP